MTPVICGDDKCGAWITDDQDPNLDFEVRAHAVLRHGGEEMSILVGLSMGSLVA